MTKHRLVYGLLVAAAVAVLGGYLISRPKAATIVLSSEAENGAQAGMIGPGDPNGASGNASIAFGKADVSSVIPLPPQPAGIAYADTPPAGAIAAYAHPGGMVIAGRTGYDSQAYKDMAAAGGTELIYLDAMIDNAYGRYAQMLMQASDCGAAIPKWPGSPKANDSGNLNDFRVGGVEQSKLQCVLEKMVAENPQMGGFFADDIGSRSWFPDINWDSWSATDQQAYRDGAIALVNTFRKVADEHGLIVLVNGTWGAGTLAAAGGGYPDMNQNGNARADGGVVEHHAASELAYWKTYGCSAQWATQTTVTQGKSVSFVIAATDTDRSAYAASNCFAYLTTQTDYENPPAPWTSFHANGLPHGVIR